MLMLLGCLYLFFEVENIYEYEPCRGHSVVPVSRVLREFIRSNGFH